jgi:hypothetical protein
MTAAPFGFETRFHLKVLVREAAMGLIEEHRGRELERKRPRLPISISSAA